MARGGKRAGSGRPRGALTKRTREIADKHSRKKGLMPLEVMIKAMEQAFNEGRMAEAAAFAKDAAPYMHPRLQSVMHTGDAEQPVMTENRITVEFVRSNGVNSNS